MISKNKKSSEKTSYFAGEVDIQGNITIANMVHVEGKITGDIQLKEGAEATLILHNGAEVKGNVHATTVIISGRIEGDICAEDYLEIHSEAIIIGNISYRRLEMTDGARVEGKITCSDMDNRNSSSGGRKKASLSMQKMEPKIYSS